MTIGVEMPRTATSSTICLRATAREGSRVGRTTRSPSSETWKNPLPQFGMPYRVAASAKRRASGRGRAPEAGRGRRIGRALAIARMLTHAARKRRVEGTGPTSVGAGLSKRIAPSERLDPAAVEALLVAILSGRAARHVLLLGRDDPS